MGSIRSGIQHLAPSSTAYHPQTDGQTERVNQVLEHYLRVYSNYEQDNWSSLLTSAEVVYNNATHSTLNISPFQACLGWQPKIHLDAPSPAANYPSTARFFADRAVKMKFLHQESPSPSQIKRSEQERRRQDRALGRTGQALAMQRQRDRRDALSERHDNSQDVESAADSEVGSVSSQTQLTNTAQKTRKAARVASHDQLVESVTRMAKQMSGSAFADRRQELNHMQSQVDNLQSNINQLQSSQRKAAESQKSFQEEMRRTLARLLPDRE